jgi:hypothetical protein
LLTITVTGNHAVAAPCTSAPLEIWGGDIGQFPNLLATAVVSSAGQFTMRGSFTASPGVIYRYALRNSAAPACCVALPPAGGSAVMTIE